MILVKEGKCIHCGRCCRIDCPHFHWKANRNIKKGEQFQKTGDDAPIGAFCDIFDTNITYKGCTLKTRKNFPDKPEYVRGRCGFYFVEKKGNICLREINFANILSY